MKNYITLMKEMGHEEVTESSAIIFLKEIRKHEDNYDCKRLETIHIYKLINPLDNSIFYVGRTVLPLQKRLSGHLSSFTNKRKMKVINSIIEVGKVPIIELIEDIIPSSSNEYKGYHDRERHWVNKYKADGFILTNRCFLEF